MLYLFVFFFLLFWLGILFRPISIWNKIFFFGFSFVFLIILSHFYCFLAILITHSCFAYKYFALECMCLIHEFSRTPSLTLRPVTERIARSRWTKILRSFVFNTKKILLFTFLFLSFCAYSTVLFTFWRVTAHMVTFLIKHINIHVCLWLIYYMYMYICNRQIARKELASF